MSAPPLTETTFKDAVRMYVELYDELIEASKALKGMRKKKDELGAAVLHFMKVNRIDEFQVGDGKLMRKNSKRTEALKKEYIIATLKTALGDETRVDAVMTEMNANRTTTELESLRRTRQGKSTV